MQFIGDIKQPQKKVQDPDIYVCNETVMQGRATEYISSVWPHCALSTPQTFLGSGSGLVTSSCGQQLQITKIVVSSSKIEVEMKYLDELEVRISLLSNDHINPPNLIATWHVILVSTIDYKASCIPLKNRCPNEMSGHIRPTFLKSTLGLKRLCIIHLTNGPVLMDALQI